MRIDTTAIDAMEPDGLLTMLHVPFRGTEWESLTPVIAKLHTAWRDDPARILAFFMRDNRELMGGAKQLLGLEVLNWAEGMKATAREQDSFEQMVVMTLADNPVSDSPGEDFKKAVLEKRWGMALWAVITHPDLVAESVGDEWPAWYLQASNGGNGLPYSIAQTLNGAMAREDSARWKAGVKEIAKANGDPRSEEYFTSEGRVFAENRSATFDGVLHPKWQAYGPEEPEPEGAFDAYDIVSGGYLTLKQMMADGLPPALEAQMIQMARDAGQGCNRFLLATYILATGKVQTPIEDVIADLEKLEIGQ